MATTLQASASRSLLAASARAFVLAVPVWLAACGAEGEMSGGPGPGLAVDGGSLDPTPESSPEARAALIIFDESRVHEVKLFLSEADWQSILDDSRGDEPRLATLSLDGVVIANVGVRPSGESSRVPGNRKISMRVDFDAFDKKKELGGLESIKLTGSWDDPFLIRDQLAYWYYRQFMPAPREVTTQLWVNGQLRGAYEIEEIWSKRALKRHFADSSGPLYRIRGVAGVDPYEFVGMLPSVYVPMPWDPKGKNPPEDHMAIGPALRILKEEPARLNEVIDVENMLTYFAVSTVLSNTDGFASGFEVDDVYQYRDPMTGRFFMLPWDPDNTFGSINDPPTRSIFENYGVSRITRLLQTELRERFFAKLAEVMTRMPVERVHAEIDRVSAQIRPILQADGMKMYPTDHFEWSAGYVKGFVTARYESVKQQISQPAAP
jgi:hypothetical protein